MASTPHRDFDARPKDAPALSGTFDLGGTTWRIRSRDDVPYELMRSLLPEPTPENLTEDERRERARRVFDQTDDFYRQTIVAEQVDQFLAMIHDPHGPFSQQKARDIPGYIAECLFSDKEGDEDGDERPTTQPELSRAGRRATGRTSKAVSSSRATPRSRSSA